MALPSPPDPRDWLYVSRAKRLTMAAPSALDLRKELPPVRNQGSRGTCAAFTAAAIKEYQERVDTGFDGWMSPEFVYYHRENRPGAGMYGRDVMKILQNKGIVPDYLYEYRSDEKAPAPMPDLLGIAAKYKIQHYARVNTIGELKQALMQNGPCYISFPVYENRPEFWRPAPGEESSGGHAVCVVGWTAKGFILRNSWGNRWNGDGHVIYPFDEFGAHWEIWATIDEPDSPQPEPDPRPCLSCEVI